MQREGASKARMPEMNAQRLCKDAKPTKHTQTLTLRKARGIVRFWEVYAERGVVVQSLRLDGKKFAT